MLSLCFRLRALLLLAACVAAPATHADSRLINLSSRAWAGEGADALIAGFVIAGDQPKRTLIRAVGPTLGQFGVKGSLPQARLQVFASGGAVVASSDTWESTLAPSFTQVGAFSLPTGSRDAALIATLSPGTYTAQASGPPGQPGIALVEVYELDGAGKLINLSTRSRIAPGDQLLISGLVVSPGESRRRILVRAAGPTLQTLGLQGTLADPAVAVLNSNGQQIASNDNWGDFNAASNLTTVMAAAGAFPFTSGSKDSALVVELTPGSYSIQVTGVGGSAGISLIELYDLAGSSSASASPPAPPAATPVNGTLYVSRLRPALVSSTSTAFGTVTLRLDEDGRTATLNVSISNLSSPQTAAYLRLGRPGDGEATYLLRLPNGQIRDFTWTLSDTGGVSAGEIAQAIRDGRVFVSIATADQPGGELAGELLRASGSQSFTPPPSPPAINLAELSEADAARFLTQATFGARWTDVGELRAKGITAWLDEQFSRPASLHRAGTMADYALSPPKDTSQPDGKAVKPNGSNRQAAWFKIVVDGEDQLRQRVAFALSEIFVVSDVETLLNQWQEATAAYYDVLVQNAFGDFRTLLKAVTLNPMMGTYLSHLRNAKTDPKTGAMPDENFAREIMQLFSIGLVELQPDGTLRLDTNGQPIATYDQTVITEMARVFTGWGYFSSARNAGFRTASANRFEPMMLYPDFHDNGQKRIVTGRILPANQGGERDLEDTLDVLVNHPNTGPFIARRLIQRLVTSNPSPGYVYRVAQTFANNGQGRRGDLGAVVRAILLDPEARSPELLKHPSYGKLKEPLLRLTQLMRAGQAYSNAGRYWNPDPQELLGQAVLRSPTVFNFFEPDYVQPGRLAQAGLYSPEFQIHNDSTAISVPNAFYGYVFVPKPERISVRLQLTDFVPLADQPETLVDRAGLLLASGQLRSTTRARILEALRALPAGTSAVDRARTAVYLVMISPEAAVQR